MTEVNGINGLPSSNVFTYSTGMNPYYDIEDLDPTYSNYPMGNYMGINGSIFGSAPMFGMPMMGMGGNNQEYFNNMREYQQFYTDYNVDQQRMQRNADLRINGSMEAIQTSFAVLKDKISQNEQTQILEAYQNFVTAVGNAYGEGTEQEVKARASMIYSQMNGGKSLVQDIREHGSGSFGRGVVSAMTFGLYNPKSSEDNISKITGAPVGLVQQAKKGAGRLAGAGIVGIIAGGLTALAQGAKAGANAAPKSGKAGIIGLVAAGISVVASFIGSKVSA